MSARQPRHCPHKDKFEITTELEVRLINMLEEVRWALRRKEDHHRLSKAEIGDTACWICIQNPFARKKTKKQLREEEKARNYGYPGDPPLFRV